MNSTKVSLSPGAVYVATAIATMRQEINRAAGTHNLKSGAQDPMTTELVGIFGELAFAQWANVMPDLSTNIRSGSFDASFRGLPVDVKTTRRLNNPRWYADARAGKRADIYVFAVSDWATVELCGWLPFEQLPESIKGIERHALRPMAEMLEVPI